MTRQARSLDIALAEVNAAAPGRSKDSDGGIGDPDHASRDSDHNPNGAGVWRARDFTHDPAGGFDAGEFASFVASKLGKHPALGSGAYVIFNRRIISTDRLREGWRYYGGVNAHKQHVHVSVATRAAGYDSTAPWGWEAPVKIPTYKPLATADAVFWNMNNGARPGVRNALEAINKSGARVIALNECSGHWPVLRDFANDRGFTVITGKGELGTASAILARHRSGHASSGVLTVRVPWRGPKGKTIDGRTLIYEKAIVNSRRIMTVDLHQVWGPNRDSNDEAKRAVVEHVRRWAEKNPTWDIFIGPDHNESRTSTAPFSPLGTANAIGGRILAGGSGPDYIIYRPAIVTPGGARPALPRVAVGPDLDSDHDTLRVNY